MPDEVTRDRDRADSESAKLDEILQPRIDGHLLTYQMAIDALIDAHRGIAETMNFGLRKRTRWTAVWEMSGRCLGLSNCLLVQLRGGFASETVPTLRAIHEAGQILTVLAGPGEERLLKQWLDDDDYISAKKARAAEARIAGPFVRELKARGIDVTAEQVFLSTQVYDQLSKAAHNMRIGFLESVSEPLRRFSYGPHPDPIQRAVHVEFGGQSIEEVILRIGSALATRFLGAAFYRDVVERLLSEIKAIRKTMPLDPPTVRALRI